MGSTPVVLVSHRVPYILVVIATAVLGLQSYVLWQVRDAVLATPDDPQQLTILAPMATLTTYLCDRRTNTMICIETTCEPGETPEQCRARHDAAIASWQAVYPDAVFCDENGDPIER